MKKIIAFALLTCVLSGCRSMDWIYWFQPPPPPRPIFVPPPHPVPAPHPGPRFH